VQTSETDKSTLYLLPNTLGRTPENNTIPDYVLNIVRSLDVLIVENIQTARKYLQWVGETIPEYEILFFELNRHTKSEDIIDFIQPLKEGKDIGILSEAGCPGVADPGSSVVKMAHNQGFKVVPLVGPNSILMALMASGLNGQSFTFWGYLPINSDERIRKLKDLEEISRYQNQTQIFMETPFRNMELLKDILHNCDPNTYLCTATDITLPNEIIISKSITKWKNDLLPELDKRPTIFLIYSAEQVRQVKTTGKRRKKRKH